jgi:hypothetical protein
MTCCRPMLTGLCVKALTLMHAHVSKMGSPAHIVQHAWANQYLFIH